jgi:hypothetical protein
MKSFRGDIELFVNKLKNHIFTIHDEFAIVIINVSSQIYIFNIKS